MFIEISGRHVHRAVGGGCFLASLVLVVALRSVAIQVFLLDWILSRLDGISDLSANIIARMQNFGVEQNDDATKNKKL